LRGESQPQSFLHHTNWINTHGQGGGTPPTGCGAEGKTSKRRGKSNDTSQQAEFRSCWEVASWLHKPEKYAWMPKNKHISGQVGKSSFITQAGSTPTGRAALMSLAGCGADGETRKRRGKSNETSQQAEFHSCWEVASLLYKPGKCAWMPNNKHISGQVGKSSFITQAGSTPTGRAALMPPTGCEADGETKKSRWEKQRNRPTNRIRDMPGNSSSITQAGAIPTGRAALMPPTGCEADGKTKGC